jgi:three-Cys-motif partner protein
MHGYYSKEGQHAMHAPRTTLWKMPELTGIKHKILRNYLEWWFPMMLNQHESTCIIDGFVGPGEYTGGEIGSPLVAIDTLLRYMTDPQQLQRVAFVFIEEQRKRHDHLYFLLKRRKQEHPAISFVDYHIEKGTFAGVTKRWLASVEKHQTIAPPIFAFIDPFGFSDTPMSVITRLMQYPYSEVLITFMYEEINRFLSHPDEQIQHHLTQLFGTTQWKCIDLTCDREQQLCRLYHTQLLTLGNTKYVCMFRMKNRRNITDYFLVFGTHRRDSLEQMKDIFWKIDPKDGFTYAASINHNQLYLIPPEPDYTSLAQQLYARFTDTTIDICELDEYILAHTRFRRQDREHALAYLAQGSLISFAPPSRSGAFSTAQQVHFL